MEKVASSSSELNSIIVFGHSEIFNEVALEANSIRPVETALVDPVKIDSLSMLETQDLGGREVFVALGPEQLNFRRTAAILQVKAAKGRLQTVVSSSARVANGCQLGANVFVGSCALVGSGVQILENTFIGSCATIGAGCRIGKNTWIAAHAVIEAGSVIGDHCVIGSGVTIAAKTQVGKFCEISSAGRYSNDIPEQTYIIEGFDKPIFSHLRDNK